MFLEIIKTEEINQKEYYILFELNMNNIIMLMGNHEAYPVIFLNLLISGKLQKR